MDGSGGISYLEPSGYDDSARIQALIDQGGEVLLGEGTFLAAGLTIPSNVTIRGRGVGVTTLKLNASANTDLLSTEGFSGLTGGGTTGGVNKFAISDMTLDGNSANNTSGWPLRIYGYDYSLTDLYIKDGESGGLWSEWGPGGNNMEASVTRFKIHNCVGPSLVWKGPHDSRLFDGVVWRDSSLNGNVANAIYTDDNGAATEFSGVHAYGPADVLWNLEAQTFCVNCISDGSPGTGVWMKATGCVWVGGSIYGTSGSGPGGSEVGLRLGDTSGGVFTGQCRIDTYLAGYVSGDVPINFDNAGYNSVKVNAKANFSPVFTGSIDANSNIEILNDGTSSTTNSYAQIARAPMRLRGGLAFARTAPSSWPYTATFNDTMIAVDSASARTVNLPAASSFHAGQLLIIKDRVGSAGANNITIARAGSDTIDGATSLTISSNNGVARLVSNGSNRWEVI